MLVKLSIALVVISTALMVEAVQLIPGIFVQNVHYLMTERITSGSNDTRTFHEITASQKNGLMRVKTSAQGVKSQTIYDNGLGVVFNVDKDGQCNVEMGNDNAPGKNYRGVFKVENLFFYDYDFEYKGTSTLEDRLKMQVKDWESVLFNVIFNGKKYDKLVITQSFIESPKDTVFDRHSLVRTVISAYELDKTSGSSEKKYNLVTKIVRDYMKFKSAETEYEFHEYFTIKECKNLISDKKVTLNFKLACEDYSPDCINAAKTHINEFREEFENQIILHERISPLRIDDMQYRFTDSAIEFDVTFLDKPNFDVLIKPENMLVSSETFLNAKARPASNEKECLDSLSRLLRGFSVGIYRPEDSFCGYLKEMKDFKTDNKSGQSSNVYIFPLKNFTFLKRELPLDTLLDTYLENKLRGLTLKDHESHSLVPKNNHYKITDIVAVN
uniref:Uncharacterized protein LOC107369220 isoform X1 n=1 Tax=Tetranychus evansi TaxID=178897 RepID=A0A3G5AP81_9ACAR|nr:uncharacterized protein LOC107369220 isoform X1 [Tetranychus evansi]